MPSVIGLGKDAAIGALHSAGFNVAIEHAVSDQPADTVIDQEPRGGTSAGPDGHRHDHGRARPNRARDRSRYRASIGHGPGRRDARSFGSAGFEVSVVREQECDPADPECFYVPGVVW